MFVWKNASPEEFGLIDAWNLNRCSQKQLPWLTEIASHGNKKLFDCLSCKTNASHGNKNSSSVFPAKQITTAE